MTSLQMAWISLIDEKLDLQFNGRNIILFDVYFGKLLLISTYLLCFSTRVHEKKCWDMPSATLTPSTWKMKFCKNDDHHLCKISFVCLKTFWKFSWPIWDIFPLPVQARIAHFVPQPLKYYSPVMQGSNPSIDLPFSWLF